MEKGTYDLKNDNSAYQIINVFDILQVIKKLLSVYIIVLLN